MLENNFQPDSKATHPDSAKYSNSTSKKGTKGQMEWRKRHSKSLLVIGRSNPWIPLLLFVPLISALLGYSAFAGKLTAGPAALIYLFGMLGWTLLEYILHRFSFHTSADPLSKSINPLRWMNRLSSGVHGLHHDQPKLPDLIVAPPILSFPTALVYLLLGYLAVGELEMPGLFVAGLTSAYLYYEWVHYSTHCRRPRTKVGRYQTKYHMVHHFADSRNYFGVTSPIWDIVFGTKPKSIKSR